MKEETKKKLCKISKIVGFAITFGFAVFGVLCAAMLIGNGSKKDDIKTLDTSLVQNEVRSERNFKPRKAPEFNESENLLGDGQSFNSYNGVYAYSDYMINYEGYYKTYLRTLEAGYYYIDIVNAIEGLNLFKFDVSFSNMDSLLALGQGLNHNERETYPDGISGVNLSDNFFDGRRRGYFYLDKSYSLTIGFSSYGSPSLYLVDTMDIPSEDILELPNNWSPLRMVAKNVNKENNLIFDTAWNYWAGVPQVNGQPMLDLSTMLFRNQGRLYNHIYIYLKSLDGLKYATNSENIGTGASTDWCADRVEYALVLNNSVKYNYLASSVGTSILQGESVYNLGLNWSNPSARVLEILDKRYPDNSAIGSTLLNRFPRSGSTTLDPVTGETIKPFGYGVWDYEFLFEYSNITSVDFVLGGSSDVFGLLTGAFNGLLPIFNVQILPNITLGILLFLPLIGGIIVIIIRVIKK